MCWWQIFKTEAAIDKMKMKTMCQNDLDHKENVGSHSDLEKGATLLKSRNVVDRCRHRWQMLSGIVVMELVVFERTQSVFIGIHEPGVTLIRVFLLFRLKFQTQWMCPWRPEINILDFGSQ